MIIFSRRRALVLGAAAACALVSTGCSSNETEGTVDLPPGIIEDAKRGDEFYDAQNKAGKGGRRARGPEPTSPGAP